MAIYIVDGDLIKSDCTVIGHQANCFSTMGAGIAKQIRLTYPEAYKADVDFPYPNHERLGKCSNAYVDSKQRVVVNLYGQFRYGRIRQHTDYDALTSSLRAALLGLRELEAKGFPIKFGLPYGMGCNLAGGKWEIVHQIITNLSDEFNRDIYIYKFK